MSANSKTNLKDELRIALVEELPNALQQLVTAFARAQDHRFQCIQTAFDRWWNVNCVVDWDKQKKKLTELIVEHAVLTKKECAKLWEWYDAIADLTVVPSGSDWENFDWPLIILLCGQVRRLR